MPLQSIKNDENKKIININTASNERSFVSFDISAESKYPRLIQKKIEQNKEIIIPMPPLIISIQLIIFTFLTTSTFILFSLP